MIIKCKMCGGDLNIAENLTVAECEYCGTKQTLPRLDDERKANLYDRASHFRRNNEFDKAANIYEQILSEDTTDAEAYWSLVLCKYGIEYVEDPATHKRVPTVNRAQFTSVVADEDYKAAISHADVAQRILYEEEAKAIDEIQRGILEISSKEEPFDVFICYKETDNSGRRTPDSVLATELYHELTRDGFKVFFSRITLEDKLGTAYEPYIFAALNSAKVMVVLGTKPEYFNAVWVKNEWSRYLALIKNGAKKMLIPAYKDMDPYDLPEEFSHLQAQDMSKLGFMQDLVRGIKKIADSAAPKTETVRETVIASGAMGSVEPLLKRAFMFLEDGKWSDADEYCEKVLDLDPECALAYVAKMMVAGNIRKREDLGSLTAHKKAEDSYRKVMRFADKELGEKVNADWLGSIYKKAMGNMEAANASDEYRVAAALFGDIRDYSDAAAKADECIEKANILDYIAAKNRFNSAISTNDYLKAGEMFGKLGNYSDSKERAEACNQAAYANDYKIAMSTLKSAVTDEDCKRAKDIFLKLGDYSDSRMRAAECDTKVLRLKFDKIIAEYKKAKGESQVKAVKEKFIAFGNHFNCNEFIKACEDRISQFTYDEACKKKNEVFGIIKNANRETSEISTEMNKAIALFEKVITFKDSAEKINACRTAVAELVRKDAEEKQLKAKKRSTGMTLMILGVLLVVAAVAGAIVNVNVLVPSNYYKDGEALLAEGKYEEAILYFSEAGNYKDSKSRIGECNYYRAQNSLDAKNYREALGYYMQAGSYLDADAKRSSLMYDLGYKSIEAGWDNSFSIKSDGTVIETSGELYTSYWKNVVSVVGGSAHVAALKTDGTVVVRERYNDGMYEDSDWSSASWTDIVSIASGSSHIVGLKSDGTVVASGENYSGQCEVSEWKNIDAIACGPYHTVGLKSNGRVVAAGGHTDEGYEISGWRDIKKVVCSDSLTVGLTEDGRVVCSEIKYDYSTAYYGVSGWRNIIDISCSDNYIIGLRSNGTVVVTNYSGEVDFDTSSWTGVVAVSCSDNFVVALKSDGTVVAAGDDDVLSAVVVWNDIVAIDCGSRHVVGLKSDGSAVAAGDNSNDQCEVTNWSSIIIPKKIEE